MKLYFNYINGCYLFKKTNKLLLVTFYFLTLIFNNNSYGQEVKISRDINIRNDFAYDLFTIKENIYFYRDKGFDYYIDIFDKDLNFKRSQELVFEEKRLFIEAIQNIDTGFIIYQSYKKKDNYFIRAIRYDEEISVQDTLEIIQSEELLPLGEFKYVYSEDKTILLLFAYEKDKIYTFGVDVKSFSVISSYIFNLNDNKSIIGKFEEVVVSNTGEVFFLFERERSSWSKKDKGLLLINIDQDALTFNEISCLDGSCDDPKMAVDNKNKAIVIAGLWGEDDETETYGYYIFKENIAGISAKKQREISMFTYDEDILKDLGGVTKRDRKNRLLDFFAKDIILRADGGIVLITEMQREFSRRAAGSPTFDRTMIATRGYTDYYKDDLILFSINPDGELLWRKILFKKQFSQDDEGIYSSYFLMKLPSQLHIIYNDEIKNNSTVSEYIVDPLGNFERNSLLSTEYKNLKLRFRDGIQVSGTAFIVPSEKSSKVNLVKVEY